MKRRAFLGFLGGAAVSGPTVAKAAASDISSLSIPSIGAPNSPMSGGVWDVPSSDNSWAKQSLKRFLGKTAEQIAYEKRDIHVSSLDPNIACLRSVALGRKIEMTRTIAYERREKMHEWNLRGHIAGWWG